MAAEKVKKKGLKKAAKEQAAAAPAASPKTSPKVAPKLSPKLSPKTSPKASPKTDPVDKEKLTKQAVAEILRGISLPDAQKNGQTFIPETWHTEFKPTLGAYKKFVLSQSDKLHIVEGASGNFVVRKAGDSSACPAPVAGKKGSGDWKKDLEKAWNCFCSTVPKGERTIDAFTAALPKAALATRPGGASPKLSPKMSPKQSPKAAPAADAGAATEGKKVKKKNKKNA
eukprot:TRINITY_DN48357_c0_g1_i1.p1 TRINITY_DN48357_c0_g1~~TRINITY_DN48357_c0_g1_i1.p1  ORF type:complete len:227 (+),score=76.73 TRINITY_DN48357_c0_g1_i1:137-817(+)